MYCMYMYVLYVSSCIVCIHLVFASIAVTGTRITTASRNDRLLRRHPAGLTQGTPGHARKHFFPPSLYPPTTPFRAPPPPPSEVPEPPPPARLDKKPGQIRACRPGPKTRPILLGKFRRFLRHTASATAPQRPLPTVIGACMYVTACACIACIECMCMYMYVLSECVCI